VEYDIKQALTAQLIDVSRNMFQGMAFNGHTGQIWHAYVAATTSYPAKRMAHDCVDL